MHEPPSWLLSVLQISTCRSQRDLPLSKRGSCQSRLGEVGEIGGFESLQTRESDGPSISRRSGGSSKGHGWRIAAPWIASDMARGCGTWFWTAGMSAPLLTLARAAAQG
jgi:hypothetical protein